MYLCLIFAPTLSNVRNTIFMCRSKLTYWHRGSRVFFPNNLLCSLYLISYPISLIDQVAYHVCSADTCQVHLIHVYRLFLIRMSLSLIFSVQFPISSWLGLLLFLHSILHNVPRWRVQTKTLAVFCLVKSSSLYMWSEVVLLWLEWCLLRCLITMPCHWLFRNLGSTNQHQGFFCGWWLDGPGL